MERDLRAGRACNAAVDSVMLTTMGVIEGQCPIIGLPSKQCGAFATQLRQIIIGGLQMYSFTLRLAGICLLGVAISSSRASAWWPSPETAPDAPAQTEPADKPKTVAPPKQDPKAADKPKIGDTSKAGEKLQPEVKPKVKTNRKGRTDAARRAAGKKRKSKAKFQMNPDAKWACDQQTATLEPVWRGETTLTFPFLIRNDGTADLRIRAKGG